MHNCQGRCIHACDHQRSVLGHVTIHHIPRKRSTFSAYGLPALFLLLWWQYSVAVKMRSIIVATVFTVMEYYFTWYTSGQSYTSFAQFWANLLYAPIMLDYYHILVQNVAWGRNPAALYILMFPANVWVFELIFSMVFTLVYTRNVAWCYCDHADSLCRGAIRLGHWPWWMCLGTICYILYPALQYLLP